MDNIKILLTGATGHSGRWFIERLKREKFMGELICLVRDGNDVSHLEKSGLNYVIIWGVIEDEIALNTAMQGVDVVIHIAGIQISKLVVKAAIANNVNWAILVFTTGRY